MIRRAIYLATLVVSGWKFLKMVQGYRATGIKRQHKQALHTWEGEGGNPSGRRRPGRA